MRINENERFCIVRENEDLMEPMVQMETQEELVHKDPLVNLEDLASKDRRVYMQTFVLRTICDVIDVRAAFFSFV